MLKQVSALLFFLSGVLLFQQNDYKLEFERVESDRSNKEYVTNLKVITYKYNRTAPAVNVTFTYNKNHDNDFQMVVQTYTFLSNEYRLFPLRFQFSFCNAVNDNEFGLGRVLACGNFTSCVFGKRTYHICNWAPDESRFPPRIPNGRYMLELQLLHKNNIEVMAVRLYGRVYRPIV